MTMEKKKRSLLKKINDRGGYEGGSNSDMKIQVWHKDLSTGKFSSKIVSVHKVARQFNVVEADNPSSHQRHGMSLHVFYADATEMPRQK